MSIPQSAINTAAAVNIATTIIKRAITIIEIADDSLLEYFISPSNLKAYATISNDPATATKSTAIIAKFLAKLCETSVPPTPATIAAITASKVVTRTNIPRKADNSSTTAKPGPTLILLNSINAPTTIASDIAILVNILPNCLRTFAGPLPVTSTDIFDIPTTSADTKPIRTMINPNVNAATVTSLMSSFDMANANRAIAPTSITIDAAIRKKFLPNCLSALETAPALKAVPLANAAIMICIMANTPAIAITHLAAV